MKAHEVVAGGSPAHPGLSLALAFGATRRTTGVDLSPLTIIDSGVCMPDNGAHADFGAQCVVNQAVLDGVACLVDDPVAGIGRYRRQAAALQDLHAITSNK